jgi:hypothetical protein
MIQPTLTPEIKRYSELEGIESSQPIRKAVPANERLGLGEMIRAHAPDFDKASGDVNHQSSALESSFFPADLSATDFDRKHRLNLNKPELRDQDLSVRLCHDRCDMIGSQFWMVVLTKSAGVQKIVDQSTILALGDYIIHEGAGNF